MYTSAIIMFSIIFSFVMLGLYFAGKQDSVEKKLDRLIVHINKYSEDATAHLKETIAHARESLNRFDKLENLTENQFLKEEKVIKDLIAELSAAKKSLAKA